ncbi:MAG: NifU family protein [Flavobacteriales bacterium]|nr:NifU family protein [Flavobacteriales bacterium]
MEHPEQLIQSIEKALDEIRPFLNNDGGDISLVEVTPDMVVRVKLHGNCKECSMKLMTMRAGIMETLKKSVPGVKDVVEV